MFRIVANATRANMNWPCHGSNSDGDADQMSGKIGKMTLEFLHNFNFNTNLLANIW